MVRRLLTGVSALFLACQVLQAGGSGLNVVVVANQNSSNSLALANYYAEKRAVPPQNILRISWMGGRIDWSPADLETYLLTPLRAMLVDRRLTNQADYLVLSMDLPYRVIQDSSINSTTSALFYGFKTNAPAPGAGLPDSCSLPTASSNSFAGSEMPFRLTPPGNLGPTNLLTTMITASNLASAKLIVDQGTTSDQSFPTQTVWLGKGSDFDRNVRYWQYDHAIFNTRLLGYPAMARTDSAGLGAGFGTILGFQSGAYSYGIGNTWFAPGAMADNLTSYGGVIFQNNGGQLNLLSLLAAGASGSYGTVVEPCAWLEKFPSPQVYFYQARGFTLAESYYQGLTNPYQGLLVGEPLAAPFSRQGNGSWAHTQGTRLFGTTNLTLSFSAADNRHPLQQVDLFVDGQWNRTLTNIPPAPGNLLQATINGRTISYVVPAGATSQTIASGWAALFNAEQALTKVQAVAHGDRIELSYTELASASALPITVNASQGAATRLSTHAYAAQPAFLESTAAGIRSYVVSGTPAIGTILGISITLTNGSQTSFSVTNSGSQSLYEMAQALQQAVNTSPTGISSNGVRLIDLVNRTAGSTSRVEFNLQANSPGWRPAQIQVARIGSLSFSPSGNNRLDENIQDLRPRNHLYVAAGIPTLALTFPLDTTGLADGTHEFLAVAMEGTHIRTQTHTPLSATVQNLNWSASIESLFGGSNTVAKATLSFRVSASLPEISTIELYSTGGRIGSATGIQQAVFNVPGNTLGAGLHPFFAIVTASNGQVFRTETYPIRLIGDAPARFPILITAPPPVLNWPAIAGQSYEIMATTNLGSAFMPIDIVAPSNSEGRWTDPQMSAQRYYRVRTIPGS